MQVGETTITWDDRINQVANMYGELLIDYAHYLFEERFIVGFGGSRNCC
ncbi:MAG TPA: hypothetical protein PKJ13_13170 [bacterium]|jgi:hypothetical protein|nr:hypothetical protein [bacterium]HOC26262.1 hypothetical protein [bacterium]HOH07711.1 hypothetical protein [bacterium]HOY44577.1 hypothetical protein [bacterium]HPG83957.1 hypothetical protein [bacterium]